MVKLRLTGLTHLGAQRPGNEDCIVLAGRVAAESDERPVSRDIEADAPVVAAVADGMGGHAAGEVASGHVAARLAEAAGEITDAEAAAALLRRLNAELYEQMEAEAGQRGMGTTVAGLVLGGARVIVFNVGDSRVYRLRAGRIEQLSTDDTPGPKLDDGRTAAVTTPMVTQALGGSAGYDEIVPHVLEEPLEPGARYLACTDGLTDLVGVDEIVRLIGEDDAEAATALFRAAMERGGRDNISLVLVRALAA